MTGQVVELDVLDAPVLVLHPVQQLPQGLDLEEETEHCRSLDLEVLHV